MRHSPCDGVRMLFVSSSVASRLIAVVLVLVVSAAVSPIAVAKEKTPHEQYLDDLKAAVKIEDSLVRGIKRVRQSSVSVLCYVTIRRGGDSVRMLAGCGSGVIIRYKSKLWIVTNVHVIARAKEIEVVTADGVHHAVEEHDSILEYDIALLKFSNKPKKRPKHVTLKPNVSESQIKEGSWVIATGTPFFLATDGRSVTTLGVVSGKDRYLPGQYNYVGAVQHDAEVNPGNSGGPLWDLKGQLVGINGKIATSSRIPGGTPTNTGASFSLPVHQVNAYLKLLVREDNAQAGYLGLQTKTWSDKRGRPSGAEITKLQRGSPVRGRKAPAVGDVITAITIKTKRTAIYTSMDLRNALSTHSSGEKVSLVFKPKGGSGIRTWKGVLGSPPRGRR